MTSLPMPTKETMELFKRELWKDQRRLETRYSGKIKCLEKYFQSALETEREVAFISRLKDLLNKAKVPDILDARNDHVVFRYIHGIRLFNLFVELDRMEPPLDSVARTLKVYILNRAEANQREIQAGLISIIPSFREVSPYPAGPKIGSIVDILSQAIGIVVDRKKIERELQIFDELWRLEAVVPFRDATTKNMVLADPTLWLGNFESEEARRRYLIDSLREDGGLSWRDAPIYDFDFSSCEEDSSPEDDPISLKFHERTWNGWPSSPEDLIWHGTPNAVRAALTFFVRYYRFGGRKAAYRLLHPSAHRVRFRHDNDVFYFQRLTSILTMLWPEARKNIPELLAFTQTVARYLEGGRPEVDHFMAAGLGEKRRYYVDMYPD